jgi:phosphoacetylglucosamine mutase
MEKSSKCLNKNSQIELNSDYEKILNCLEKYDSKLPIIDKFFSCGTSGFRYDEKELDKVGFRIAVVTSIKSQFYGGLPMGIMVTASHNKYTDNGFKIAGIDGETISKYWEDKYTDIVNSKNISEDIRKLIAELSKSDEADSKYFFRDNLPIVVLACDTRRSSSKFVNIISDCLKILNVKFKFYGVQTTPALHFLTVLNQKDFKLKNFNNFHFVDSMDYWKFLKNGYLAFNTFLERYYCNSIERTEENKYENEFTIDCSNGIAGFHHQNIINLFNNSVMIYPININFQETCSLNEGCGAEFVHKDKKLPINYGNNVYVKNASFDGDVDRLVYLYYFILIKIYLVIMMDQR